MWEQITYEFLNSVKTFTFGGQGLYLLIVTLDPSVPESWHRYHNLWIHLLLMYEQYNKRHEKVQTMYIVIIRYNKKYRVVSLFIISVVLGHEINMDSKIHYCSGLSNFWEFSFLFLSGYLHRWTSTNRDHMWVFVLNLVEYLWCLRDFKS